LNDCTVRVFHEIGSTSTESSTSVASRPQPAGFPSPSRRLSLPFEHSTAFRDSLSTRVPADQPPTCLSPSSSHPLVVGSLPSSSLHLQNHSCGSVDALGAQQPECYRTTPSNEKSFVRVLQSEILLLTCSRDQRTSTTSQDDDLQTPSDSAEVLNVRTQHDIHRVPPVFVEDSFLKVVVLQVDSSGEHVHAEASWSLTNSSRDSEDCLRHPARAVGLISAEFDEAVPATQSLDSKRVCVAFNEFASHERLFRTPPIHARYDGHAVCLIFVENEASTPFVLKSSLRLSLVSEDSPPGHSAPPPSSEYPPPPSVSSPCLSVVFLDSQCSRSTPDPLLAGPCPFSSSPIVRRPLPMLTGSLRHEILFKTLPAHANNDAYTVCLSSVENKADLTPAFEFCLKRVHIVAQESPVQESECERVPVLGSNPESLSVPSEIPSTRVCHNVCGRCLMSYRRASQPIRHSSPD
jgi:hypothetical protein